jgi:hypothetical protein
MRICGVCGAKVTGRKNKRWCSANCYVVAKIDAKRIKYQTDPVARQKQLIRARAAYQVRDKEPCRVCGSEHAERHHIRYDNEPGSVEWYCRLHHSQLHAQMRRSQ